MGEGHLRICYCPSIENIREGYKPVRARVGDAPLSGARITRGYVGHVHDRTTPGLRCRIGRTPGGGYSAPGGVRAAAIDLGRESRYLRTRGVEDREHFEVLGCNPAEIVEYGRRWSGLSTVKQWVPAPRDPPHPSDVLYAQPGGGESWSVPPQTERIVQQQPFGYCLRALGPINKKNILRAFLNAVEAIEEVIQRHATSQPPVGRRRERRSSGSPTCPGLSSTIVIAWHRQMRHSYPYALQEPG